MPTSCHTNIFSMPPPPAFSLFLSFKIQPPRFLREQKLKLFPSFSRELSAQTMFKNLDEIKGLLCFCFLWPLTDHHRVKKVGSAGVGESSGRITWNFARGTWRICGRFLWSFGWEAMPGQGSMYVRAEGDMWNMQVGPRATLGVTSIAPCSSAVHVNHSFTKFMLLLTSPVKT